MGALFDLYNFKLYYSVWNEKTKDPRIVKEYLANTQYIHNWDLVDTSAHKLLGVYLRDVVVDEGKLVQYLEANEGKVSRVT